MSLIEVEAAVGVTDLRAAEEQFHVLFLHSPIGMALVALDGHFLSANQALCSLTGYTEKQLRSLRFQDITHPDDLAMDLAAVNALLNGDTVSYDLEKRYLRPDGNEVWIHLTAGVVRSATGVPTHFVAQVQDITEQIQREQTLRTLSEDLEKTNAALMRSNKDLAEFAAMVAHDLKSPLQSFYLHIDQLADTRLTDEQSALSRQLIDSAEWMAELVDRVLDYCRVDRELEMKAVDANGVVRQAITNLRAEIDAVNATIQVGDLPVVFGSDIQLEQLFQNLFSNGLKWNQPGISPTVSVSATTNEDGWEFSVIDNGVGIPPENRGEVFEMFSRVRGRHAAGHGIGLATCRKIVERHGGQIWVDNSYSTGACIRFTLSNHATAH